MEMYFFNNQDENRRIDRIKELADRTGLSFEDAEMIINSFQKMDIDPVKPAEKINNIVTLEKLSKKIVTKVISNINNQHRNIQPVDLNELTGIVQEILKDALKQTKMIDVAKERMENQELKKQIAELNKDRKNLKAALENSICGLVAYADPKGNMVTEQRIDLIRKSAGEALRYSDSIDTPVKPVMFFFDMDMGK